MPSNTPKRNWRSTADAVAHRDEVRSRVRRLTVGIAAIAAAVLGFLAVLVTPGGGATTGTSTNNKATGTSGGSTSQSSGATTGSTGSTYSGGSSYSSGSTYSGGSSFGSTAPSSTSSGAGTTSGSTSVP